jgi:hypothetical protein
VSRARGGRRRGAEYVSRGGLAVMIEGGGRGTVLKRLARWRVPLGFVSAVVVLWFARPTWRSLVTGGGIALVGQAVRVWAAGHLEKSREVTSSGPYRFTRHPLYVGSAIMGAGLAVAAAQAGLAALIAAYLVTTFAIAIRAEETFLASRFGGDYEAYRAGRLTNGRRFSWKRALRTNREYRAVAGLVALFALLALKVGVRS